jgi:hypothetical protein
MEKDLINAVIKVGDEVDTKSASGIKGQYSYKKKAKERRDKIESSKVKGSESLGDVQAMGTIIYQMNLGSSVVVCTSDMKWHVISNRNYEKALDAGEISFNNEEIEIQPPAHFRGLLLPNGNAITMPGLIIITARESSAGKSTFQEVLYNSIKAFEDVKRINYVEYFPYNQPAILVQKLEHLAALMAEFANSDKHYQLGDSLSVLLYELTGSAGSLGISRAINRFLIELNNFGRLTGKSLIWVLNPLEGKDDFYQNLLNILKGTTETVVDLTSRGQGIYTSRYHDRVDMPLSFEKVTIFESSELTYIPGVTSGLDAVHTIYSNNIDEELFGDEKLERLMNNFSIDNQTTTTYKD